MHRAYGLANFARDVLARGAAGAAGCRPSAARRRPTAALALNEGSSELLPSCLSLCRFAAAERVRSCVDAAALRARIEEHVRRHDLDPARRRGHLPRLGRPRLDLPLARARRARLPRLRAPRQPRAARRGVRGGRPLLPRAARRRGGRRAGGAGHRGRAPRPSLRRRARPAAGDGPHRLRPGGDDPLPPRLERDDDGDPRPPRRRRRPAAADASGATRPRRYCRAEGLDVPRRLVEPGHGPRPHPRARSCPRSQRLHPAAERNVLAALDERPAAPRAAREALLELLASREGSKRVDLGDGRVAVREYDSVWLERGPVPLDGPRALGAWLLEATPARPARPVVARRRPARGAGQEGAGPLRRRQGARARSARPGRSSCAATRSSPCRGSRPRPGGRTRSATRGRRVTQHRVNELTGSAGVDEVLIDEETLQRRIAELGARSPRTTAAATCCSSASSRARCSSWPT